jgi:hypothetical protein
MMCLYSETGLVQCLLSRSMTEDTSKRLCPCPSAVHLLPVPTSPPALPPGHLPAPQQGPHPAHAHMTCGQEEAAQEAEHQRQQCINSITNNSSSSHVGILKCRWHPQLVVTWSALQATSIQRLMHRVSHPHHYTQHPCKAC